MGSVLVVVQGPFQAVPVANLVGGQSTGLFLVGSCLRRVDSILQVLHALRFRQKTRILPLLSLGERQEPGCGRIAGVVKRKAMISAGGWMRIAKHLIWK